MDCSKNAQDPLRWYVDIVMLTKIVNDIFNRECAIPLDIHHLHPEVSVHGVDA
jgi:hypothetical protein